MRILQVSFNSWSRFGLSVLGLSLIALASAQAGAAQAGTTQKPTLFKTKQVAPMQADGTTPSLTSDGVTARIKDVAHFRGIRSNRIEGYGVVTGLNGTGDSKNVTATLTALVNSMKKKGMDVDPTSIQVKNVALVHVTALLPPYAVNGDLIDVTVSSAGDSKSLRNGTLMFTELSYAGNPNVVYATASGQISVGGYSEGGGGNAQSTGFVTVGRIPGGGIVEHEVPTTTVKEGKMFIELDKADITTAHRVEMRINEVAPEFHAVAINAGTIQVDAPASQNSTTAMAKLESISVTVDTEALVVINEKTGTIVMGGDVRLAPCAIATGSLSVKIEDVNTVSQPASFSNGTTTPVSNQKLTTTEDKAQIAFLKANTTIADLARIFQNLKLKPADIINVLQMLKEQGALKARVVTQ